MPDCPETQEIGVAGHQGGIPTNFRRRRGSFAVVKEGLHKESAQRVAIKIVDKHDAIFDAESLEQEVPSALLSPPSQPGAKLEPRHTIYQASFTTLASPPVCTHASGEVEDAADLNRSHSLSLSPVLQPQIATMKKVNHPNCVQLHEVFDEPNKTYLVLDL